MNNCSPSTSGINSLGDQPYFTTSHLDGSPLTISETSQDNTRRRSSNRSIKRRRFDDELVEYSYAGVSSSVKGGRTRTHSIGSTHPEFPVAVVAPVIPPPVAPAPPPPIIMPDAKRRHLGKPTASTSKRSKKGRTHNHIATKDLGRWKPTDDLALIIGVQQTNDLRIVHLGTKFSCRFTVQELQQRWYALLYDQAVSRVAVAAMRNLHPDMIACVQDKALWSTQEEQLLGTIKAITSKDWLYYQQTTPSVDVFADLLAAHPDVFYPARTANALLRHWQTLRLHSLLPDQTLEPLPTPEQPLALTFHDAEDSILDHELNEPVDETADKEMKLQQRRNVKEIRQLENEMGRWHVLVDSVTGGSRGELDNQTLAVLRGRLVRYLMRSREITIGRTAKGHVVDVDLSLEGPAWKVSRRQGTLRLRNTGEFYLSSEGSRPIFVDGRPILAGNKVRLYNNSVVEIACLRFIFSVNQDIIRIIHNEAIKFQLPP